MADLSDEIEADAQKAKSVEVDGQKIERRPVGELIEADKYLAAKSAAKRGPFFTRLVPPGAS